MLSYKFSLICGKCGHLPFDWLIGIIVLVLLLWRGVEGKEFILFHNSSNLGNSFPSLTFSIISEISLMSFLYLLVVRDNVAMVAIATNTPNIFFIGD
jgi:hypothetical protein